MNDADVFGAPAQPQTAPPVVASHNGGVTIQVEPGDADVMSDADVFGPSARPQPQRPQSQTLGFLQGINDVPGGLGRTLTSPFHGSAPGPLDMLALPAELLSRGINKWIVKQPETPAPAGRFAGQIVGSLPLAAEGGPALMGAFQSLLTSQDTDPLARTVDAAEGALGGKIMSKATGVLKGAIAPQIGAQLRTLMNENIPLTPGQMADGTLRRVEDSATSLPMLGDIINSAKARSIMGLNRAATNRALAPIGETLPPDVPVGRQAVAHAGDRLSDRYNQLLPGLTINADHQFVTELGDISKNAGLLPDHAKMLGDFVDSKIRPYVAADGSMSGRAMKDVEETLGSEIKDWKNSPMPADRKYARALDDLRGSLRGLVVRNNPQAGDELKRLNTGWANLAILEDAASRQGAVEGVFTPGQLDSAVRKANDTTRKRGYARGEALMQDLSDAARARLPATVPDSGSPLRHAIEAMVGVGVAKESGMLKPLIKSAVVGGTLGLPYTRIGQSTLNNVAKMDRGPMAEQMGRALTYARPLLTTTAAASAAPIAGQYLQPPMLPN